MNLREFVVSFAFALGIVSAAGTAAQTVSSIATPLLYKNDQYMFCFALPANWKGYTVVTEQWKGGPPNGPSWVGPELLIRNPAWTAATPTEDVPVMIFTLAEWQAGEKAGGLVTSGAPMGPSEIGRNKQYVFALPPRWDFDSRADLQVAEDLANGNKLKAPCGKAGGS
jgi:hypothetical protein